MHGGDIAELIIFLPYNEDETTPERIIRKSVSLCDNLKCKFFAKKR